MPLEESPKDTQPEEYDPLMSPNVPGYHQFNFNVENGPYPGYSIRLDWTEGNQCTWLHKTSTPAWVTDKELPDNKGLFIDPHGSLYLFLGNSLSIYPPSHPRNNGYTLRKPNVDDIA